EMDRLTGWRQLLPIELADLMSHMLPGDEDAPVVCHGSRTLQFAVWFASKGREVCFTGESALVPHIAAIAGGQVKGLGPSSPYPANAGHIAIHDSDSRKSVRGGGRDELVVPRQRQPRCLKQRPSKTLAVPVTQLPGGIIPRTFPPCFSSALPSSRTVRLVNAKDWCVPSRQGLEISYLDPILAQACDRPIGRLPRWTPKPPAENVDYEALIQRGCDLRLKSSPLVQTSAPSLREESLGGCAALVRGQMLAKAGDGELSNIYREVTLADIDESGFVTDASRLVPDAAPLPRSRRIARLREGDLLLTCKGSLQSLGKVGIVTQCGDNWLPSQTFYLIRTECIDPIWLFHYLRSPRALNYLRSNISGTSILQIRVADIAALPIPIRTRRCLPPYTLCIEALNLVKDRCCGMSWMACWIRLPSCSIR
ncbi:MAG: restriction endonuclease subunit S, partial [Bilophila wadsworthia]